MKTDGKKWILRIVLTLSTAAFVCWIFSNSLKTAAESTVQSSFVKELVENFLSALVPGQGVEISEHVIRKLAHFCEYALLGFLFVFYISFLYPKKALVFYSVACRDRHPLLRRRPAIFFGRSGAFVQRCRNRRIGSSIRFSVRVGGIFCRFEYCSRQA